MLMTASPPPALATPAPVTMRLETDKAVYVRGESVGLKVVITNVAGVPTSVSDIAPNGPEWQSEVLLTQPDGSTRTCRRPDNGELLSISAMYPRIEPGKELIAPRTGFRPLAKWGCVAHAIGTYTLKLRRAFLDPHTGHFFFLVTPPVVINVTPP
ncbi:MAG: hypothetical protein JO036_12340 [Candidatus Eremiobacteraeota bacterium]|nr:hypothetical protein [Candidatus Eremiobacteraeota bacterium]